MKHVTEMGSGVMIYIPSFIKTVSGIQMFTGGNTQIHTDKVEIAYDYFIFSR
jgi:hypothetical protein